VSGTATALRVLVADDEPLARLRLVQLLEQRPEVTAVVEAADGDAAAAALAGDAFDLLFLDVQMPGRDGLAVLRGVPPATAPVTVLVSAYDDYAVAAFAHGTLDYLLKPYDDERFARMMERALRRLREAGAAEALRRGLGAFAGGGDPVYPQHLTVEVRGGTRLLRAADVDWVESADNYVAVHASGERLLCRAALAAVAGQLDPRQFFRCHRRFVVNLDRVREVYDLPGGGHQLVLHSGQRLPLSRRLRHALPRLGATPEA
jgi:two-component system LytT family response regulator